MTDWLPGFATREIQTSGTRIFVRSAGSGPPLLLLHGFPESHLMWRDVAPLLKGRFSVVCADLRGYGRSGCPASTDDHLPYSKRVMAQDMVEVMSRLGFSRFSVAGHDRGGRVAYRMALDQPDRVSALAVLDIVPTEAAWDRADARLALAFWPWSLLAQPAPLPERMITAAADAIVDDALERWGSPPEVFPRVVRTAYVQTLRDPDRARAICEEYRAAATIDREHDRADRARSRRITCPVLVLWSAGAALDTWYESASGPLAIWREWADDVRGERVDGGHFFPEAEPARTAELLSQFLAPPDAAPQPPAEGSAG